LRFPHICGVNNSDLNSGIRFSPGINSLRFDICERDVKDKELIPCGTHTAVLNAYSRVPTRSPQFPGSVLKNFSPDFTSSAVTVH
jgi:hypothetical protein